MMPSFASEPHEPLAHLLIVDDEPDNLDLLEGMLARSPYQTTRAESGREALDELRAHPERFDAVLLDRMMPGIDGMDVLREMKADPRLQAIPVILQTAAGSPSQVAQGLEAGAHYYLVKPFDRGHLIPIVMGAVANYRKIRDMTRKLLASRALGMIVSGEFRFGTLDEARELAVFLARASGDPSPVAFGLQELLSNAIEHGCLDIGYAAKKQALLEGRYPALLAERAADPRHAGRYATAHIERTADMVVYTIIDPGDGFAFGDFVDYDPARLTDPNGRGIQVARELSFDSLRYLGRGNAVQASVALSAWREL